MKKKIFYLLLLTTYNSYAFQGFYIGAGSGIATINTMPQHGIFSTGNNGTQVTNTPASTFYWGYQYNKFIAIQLEYNSAYNVKIADTYKMNQNLLVFTAVGSLPLGFTQILSNFAIFAKFGAEYNVINYFDVNSICVSCSPLPNSSFTYMPAYGIGIDYQFNNFGIRAELDNTLNNTVSNNNISIFTSNSNYYLGSIYYKF